MEQGSESSRGEVTKMPIKPSSVELLIPFLSGQYPSDVRLLARSKLVKILQNLKAASPTMHQKIVATLFQSLMDSTDGWLQRNTADIIMGQFDPENDCRLLDYALESDSVNSFVRAYILRQLNLVINTGVSPCYRRAKIKLMAYRESRTSSSVPVVGTAT